MERVYKREGILFKILPCLLIAMYAIMCLIGSSVQATGNEAYTFDYDNHTVTYDNRTYKINDDIFSKKYICFTSNGGLSISVFCSDYPFYVDGHIYASSTDKYYTVKSYDENKFYFHSFSSSNMHEVLPYLGSRDLSKYNTSTEASSAFRFGPEYTYLSNFDIKDENDEVVFRGASQEALATQIKTQVQGIQLQEVIQEIIQILPVILVVVVALIAIRKAILLLLKVLRNS